MPGRFESAIHLRSDSVKKIAPVLLAQPTYMWGHVSVEKVIDKVYLKKDVPEITRMELVRVSKENLGTIRCIDVSSRW